jgi:hypothetical protein
MKLAKDSVTMYLEYQVRLHGMVLNFLFIIIISGVGLLVLRPLTGLLYQPPDDRRWWLWRNWWNEDWQGKPKYSEKTCFSATLSTTNPIWAAAVGSQRLTAWAMARPCGAQLLRYSDNLILLSLSFILVFLLHFLVKRFPFIRFQSSFSGLDKLSDTDVFSSRRGLTAPDKADRLNPAILPFWKNNGRLARTSSKEVSCSVKAQEIAWWVCY